MKELSIEEKAKRYDEAIKKAEPLYKAAEPMSGCNVIIETLFPELAESENERIRKALINGFNKFGKSAVWYNGITNGQILDWLEKQCENNMGISESTKQKLEDNLNKALEKETPESWNEFLDEQGEQKESYDTCISTTSNNKKLPYGEKRDFGYFEKQGEQKPTEWSSEQSKTLQTDDVPNESSTAAPFKTGAIGFDGEPMESKPCEQKPDKVEPKFKVGDILVSDKEDRRIFKKLKEAVNEWSSEHRKPIKIKRKIEQKPAWSEEDDIYIENIILAVEKQYPIASKDVVAWLKSLKERYTWKPSEEQMKALANALSLAKNCGEESAFDLRTLYEQLNKLKE